MSNSVILDEIQQLKEETPVRAHTAHRVQELIIRHHISVDPCEHCTHRSCAYPCEDKKKWWKGMK